MLMRKIRFIHTLTSVEYKIYSHTESNDGNSLYYIPHSSLHVDYRIGTILIFADKWMRQILFPWLLHFSN
jgi:hypothetical protein